MQPLGTLSLLSVCCVWHAWLDAGLHAYEHAVPAGRLR
jgi:hypothetical protein